METRITIFALLAAAVVTARNLLIAVLEEKEMEKRSDGSGARKRRFSGRRSEIGDVLHIFRQRGETGCHAGDETGQDTSVQDASVGGCKEKDQGAGRVDREMKGAAV